MNSGAEANAWDIAFPGGTHVAVKPTREQLAASLTEWLDVQRQAIAVGNWHGAKGASYRIVATLTELQELERK